MRYPYDKQFPFGYNCDQSRARGVTRKYVDCVISSEGIGKGPSIKFWNINRYRFNTEIAVVATVSYSISFVFVVERVPID